MRDDNTLARKLFGTAKKIADAMEAYGVTTTVEATAVADSADGWVLVDMGGAATSDDVVDDTDIPEGEDVPDPDDPDWETVASNENLSPLLGSDEWAALDVDLDLEPLDEGWTRVTYDNSGSSSATTVDAATPTVDTIESGETYTLLLEVRPYIYEDEGSEDEADGTGIDPDDVYDDIDDQVAADETEEEGASGDEGADVYTPVASIVPTTSGSQFEATSAITLDEQTTYVTLTATSGGTSLLGTQFVVEAGEVMDVEVRMSLYEGEYTGEYVPYGLLEGGSWQLVPCSANVKAGDTVQVTIKGANPVDATSTGWGDRVGTRVDAAETLAGEAKSIAEATNQNFWADGSGVHVSTEDGDPDGANNVLLNSGGMLVRETDKNRAALTPSGVAFYDGLGNNAANIVASFGAASAQIGKNNSYHVVVDNNSIDFVDNNGNVAFTIDVNSFVASLMSTLETVEVGHSDSSGHAIFEATNRSGLSSSNGNQATLQSKYGQNWLATVKTAALDNLVEIMLSTETASDYSSLTIHPTYIDLSPQSKLKLKNYAPIVVERKTAISIASTAVRNNASGSASIAKTGYTPVGFQWWWSAGTRNNFFSDYGTHIEGNTFYYRFCNLGNNSASGTLEYQILYVRNELL